jgi:L-fuculose-phosphate aldolase
MPPRDEPGESALRAQMIEVGRRLRARGLIAGAEGNLTARLGHGRLLCTPAGTNKGFLREEDLVVVDLAGRPVAEGPNGAGNRASSELLLHLACYAERPDCAAVVHAHPPHAVALTLAGEALLSCMPEAVTALGEVPTARYATPGGPLVAEAARGYLRVSRCLLLERHGALALGFSGGAQPALFEACDRMEMLEGVARVQLLAGLRGKVTALPEEELRTLAAPRSFAPRGAGED